MEKKGKGCHCRIEQVLALFAFQRKSDQQGSYFTHPGIAERQQQQHRSLEERGVILKMLEPLLPFGGEVLHSSHCLSGPTLGGRIRIRDKPWNLGRG
jgi:hypothetical protein